MPLYQDIPTISDVVRRGNKYWKTISLVENDKITPVILNPATLVYMTVRESRGREYPALRLLTVLNGGVVLEPNGHILFKVFTGSESYDLLPSYVTAEIAIGPTEDLLEPYLVLNLEVIEGIVVPVSVT